MTDKNKKWKSDIRKLMMTFLTLSDDDQLKKIRENAVALFSYQDSSGRIKWNISSRQNPWDTFKNKKQN
jgi:hypothetical protein